MTIWVMHGILAERDTGRFTHRHLLDAAQFGRALASRPTKFVDLDDALSGHGDAITIDDSTSAAAAAAELCRAHGHAVTLFANARNVAQQQTYWFVTLNTAVDGSKRKIRDRERFRKTAKREALSLACEEAREAFVLRLARDLDAEPMDVPEHLATISLERLARLQALGVRIENHGWTHGNVAAMSREEVVDEIRRGSEWLRDALGAAPRHYAVPFGDAMPPDGLPSSLYDVWHLADENRPADAPGPHIVNRLTLVAEP